jgi:hypothetical protein
MAFAVAVMKKFGDDQAGNQVALLTYFAFVATFPLLLALTTILGVALRRNPELHRDLVNSAFAEFPIIGAQIHDQLAWPRSATRFHLRLGSWVPFSVAVASPTPCKTLSVRYGRFPRWIGPDSPQGTCGGPACYCF